MADVDAAVRTGDGVAFLISAGIVYEIIATACSSPQTAEINAKRRANTLMKWVRLGIVQAALFVTVAAYIDRKHRNAIIAGGVIAGILLYAQYVYAKNAGLKSVQPGTED
jgi:K+-transporting ATPase A subunit